MVVFRINDTYELYFDEEELDDDSDNSFAAAGDWCDDSDDEDSEPNLNLNSYAPLLRK